MMTRAARLLIGVLASLALVCSPGRTDAQLRLRPASRAFWAAAAGAIATAALFDERAREASLAHRSTALGNLADAGNELGTGRNIIAGLAVAYVGARLTHHRRFADGVLRVAAGYAVPNAIVGIMKPLVGRHRPDSTNDAWRFDPLSTAGAWHSFPSSHSVHAFSLAAGATMMSESPWVGAAGYAAAGVVAWSRVYDDEHWASDVTAAAVIGIAGAATTIHWLDRRFPRPASPRPTGAPPARIMMPR